MKHIFNRSQLALSGLLFLASCVGSARLMKDADKLEALGLTEDAYDSYATVYGQYQRPEALAAMKRIAQARSDHEFAQARIAENAGYLESAYDQYGKAFSYVDLHSDIGILPPLAAREQYASLKDLLLDSYYSEAEELLLAENYDSAYLIIRKMQSIDRSNEGAAFLSSMCELMPAYKNGMKAMDLGLYRQAYSFFDEVTKEDAGFLDAMTRKRECLNKGIYTLAYVPMNMEWKQTLGEMASAAVKNELLKLNDPFLKLVSRDHLDEILKEQQSNMSDLFAGGYARAGQLMGADLILTGEFLTNAIGGVLSFRYELLDTETGRIYLSENLPIEKGSSNNEMAEWVADRVARALRNFVPDPR